MSHILSAAKIYTRNDCSFWRYKVCADIRGGSWRGRQTTVGLSKMAIFSAFDRCIFSSERSEISARLLLWYYVVPRRLSANPKIRDLEWP